MIDTHRNLKNTTDTEIAGYRYWPSDPGWLQHILARTCEDPSAVNDTGARNTNHSFIDRKPMKVLVRRWFDPYFSGPQKRPSCRRAWLLLWFFMCALAPNAGKAQLLDYVQYSGYSLAKGILGNDYTTPFGACITGAKSKIPASHEDVLISITYSADEYKQALHIDHKGQAAYYEFGGGDQLHIGHETGSSGSAFDIVLQAYTESDSDTIDNIKWDSPYDQMIASGDSGKIQAVRLACGDRYIQTVFNEARLFLVLHVSSQKTSALTSFSAKFNGSIDMSVIKATDSLGGDANIS